VYLNKCKRNFFGKKLLKSVGKILAKAHQQKRLWQDTGRIPAMRIFGDAKMVHIDRIDEAAAPTEQQLPEICMRQRLIEQQTHPRNKDALLAVGRYWVITMSISNKIMQNY